MVAGVAGGVADYLGTDANVVRLGFVALSFLGGVGIPLYVLGWVALATPSTPSYAQQWFGGRGTTSAAGPVLAAVAVVLVGWVVLGGHSSAVGLGLVLLFGGWLLFRADGRAAVAGAPPTQTAPPGSPPGGPWHGAGGTVRMPPAPRAPPLRREPRPRSVLGRVTVGTMLAVLGVAALADNAGLISMSATRYLALALTVTGLGLVVGAFAGRAYGLIALGFVLVPALLVASLAPVSVSGDMGDIRYQPSELADVEERYAIGLGELTVDLSDVRFGGDATEVEVGIGLGAAEIIVPDDTSVTVEGRMRGGETRILSGPVRTGLNLILEEDEPGDPAGGRLHLIIDGGVGELAVRRQP